MAFIVFFLLAGLATGRWPMLALSPAVLGIAFAGLGAGWWGPGLGQTWEWAFILAVAAGLVAAATGVIARRLLARVLPITPVSRRWRHVLVGLALSGVASAALGLGLAALNRPGDVELSALAESGRGDLLYAGERFEGLPLTAIVGKDPQRGATFVYGECEIPIGLDEGGCAPPLQIQNAFARDCERQTAGRALVIRGVPARHYGGLRLDLSTGRLAIVVYGDPVQVLRVARKLRSVDGSVGANELLPPPACDEALSSATG